MLHTTYSTTSWTIRLTDIEFGDRRVSRNKLTRSELVDSSRAALNIELALLPVARDTVTNVPRRS
jgi:hypothetical protein